MQTQLISKLNSVYQLKEENLSLLLSKWKAVEIQKGDFLTKKGTKENYLYFINEGIARGYIEAEEKQISLGFAYHNDFTAAIDSFVSGQPTELQLFAESKLIGFRILRSDLLALYDQNHEIERLGRLLMEMLLLLMSKQQIYYLSMSAEARYLRFIKESEHLLQLVSQKHVASYLGMSAETFSRLRKKFS